MNIRPTNKYKNVKTKIDGYTFDSKREADRYIDLKLRFRAGQITDLELQPVYPITVNGFRICKVKPDFRYKDKRSGKIIVEDVKSAMTRKLPTYRLKAKLLKACYDIDVVEVL
jgi:hypothetical protein